MQTFQLQEIKSGREDSCLWVSLGFSSELESADVLHVVCDLDPDDANPSLYVERFDQAYCCYHGVNSLAVTTDGAVLDLTAKGRSSLDLPSRVRFVAGPRRRGWQEALLVFRSMATLPAGNVVSVGD